MGNLVLGMAVLGKSALDRRGYPARRFPLLKWPDSRGIGGRFAVEQVVGLPWNHWPISRGIRNLARDMLTKEGLPQDDYHLDLVLHALVRGVEIGLMDSQLANRIVRFGEAHPRQHPSIGRDYPRTH